ncbi:hypothetical protein [Falsiroseomonas oryzae]|uniref:hypothetical protein n=1 Tax=Falsiroseomonas oryzae TaxID=2766473 RepID=UPI0022EB7CF1|nr:hypothetical protein [Roseomonas sp. MO-31]
MIENATEIAATASYTLRKVREATKSATEHENREADVAVKDLLELEDRVMILAMQMTESPTVLFHLERSQEER